MIIANKEIRTYRSNLKKIAVPKRESKNWQGINHGDLANTLVDRVESLGLDISQETWYVNPKKTIMWGALDIVPGQACPELNIGQKANFSLGVRHGNGGEYAVSFAVGARIGVCSNGMFMGDFVFKKKHTKDLDLPWMIDMALEKYIQECEALESLINGWREIELGDHHASYMILESHRQKAVNFRYLEDIYENWNKPPHEEFAPRTAWSLYNAFTETAKILTPPRQLTLLTGIRKIFDLEFGVGDAYVGAQKL